MPADANSYERDLARSVDAMGEECPACDGDGYQERLNDYQMVTWVCEKCNGTGRVLAYDAMDDADSAYERAGDR
jgi:DnaJ-class molecular chaperone